MLKRKILNRHRLLTQNICLLMTFLAMGLWNGFQWNYVLSGFLFGMYSVIHNSYLSISKKFDWDFFHLLPKPISIGVKRVLMFHAAGLAIYAFNGKFPTI